MKAAKLSLNFARYQDAELKVKAKSILQSMTGNPDFTDPIPTLAELQDAITAYDNALIAAAGFDRIAVAVKRQCRKTLEGILKQLGMYVMYVANGNVTILTSSGFSLTKTPSATYIIAPETPILKNGISTGMLVSSVKLVGGAYSYRHEITPEPLTNESVWETNTSNRANFTFRNLQPGKKYWIRVAAEGRGATLAYSQIVSQYAQ